MFVSHMKDFKLKFEYKEDGIKWYSLKYPIVWQSKHGTFTVPANSYITDIASVPTFLQKIFKPRGKFDRSSVLHDFICDEKHVRYITKHTEYYKAMISDGVKISTAVMYFTAVFCFYWLYKLING